MNQQRSQRQLSIFLIALFATTLTSAQSLDLREVSTGFLYSGQLEEAGIPAQGRYDFHYELYDAPVGGTLIGVDTHLDVPIHDGRLAVQLDFGVDLDLTLDRWLEVQVRAGGTGAFTPLTPRRSMASILGSCTVNQDLLVHGRVEGVGSANDGVRAVNAATNGFKTENSGGDGLLVAGAGASGVRIGSASMNGVHVQSAGLNGVQVDSATFDGIQVQTADRHGLKVTSATEAGVLVSSAGVNGVQIDNATVDGIQVQSAGQNGLKVISATEIGVLISSAGVNGVQIDNATFDGIQVQSAGRDGIRVSSAGALAGNFIGSVDVHGDLQVTGNLSKGSGSFLIDHPLDPLNRYLAHSFVESPDMMNVYNGNIVLGDDGTAWVNLPDYFEALNRDLRYQLTPMDAFAPLYVAERVRGNRFRIAGGNPGMTVSWQVTGVRQDPYAEVNRIAIERFKPLDKQGSYLHPAAYAAVLADQPDSSSEEGFRVVDSVADSTDVATR